MPKFRFKRSQSYNLSDSSFTVHVELVDDSIVDFSVPQNVTGRGCLEHIARYLNLAEVQYFGLRFKTKHGYQWIHDDMEVRKQLLKHGEFSLAQSSDEVLQFRTRFYTTRPSNLRDEVARLLLFQELKSDVLSGQLNIQNMAEKLGSYSLQAELGDFSPMLHTKEMIEDRDLIPSDVLHSHNILLVVDKVQKLWSRLKGMSSDAAVSQYISAAMQLKDYGLKGFDVQDGNGRSITIGACFLGVFIKHYNGRPHLYFRWPDIQRMKVKDKSLALETFSEEILFGMEDKHHAKLVLKELIVQHQFFCDEQKAVYQRHARSKSSGPDVQTDSKHSRRVPPQGGSPFTKKGRFHSPQESTTARKHHSSASPQPKTRASVTLDMKKVVGEVDLQPQQQQQQQPASIVKLPSSPVKESGPIHKLVTVVRRESSRSAGHRTPKMPPAVKEADFQDCPDHEFQEEEAPVEVKGTPKISKYIPRNLREGASIGMHDKPDITDWGNSNKSDSNIIEQNVTEMQIEIKSSSSSPSVSVSPVNVIIKETIKDDEMAVDGEEDFDFEDNQLHKEDTKTKDNLQSFNPAFSSSPNEPVVNQSEEDTTITFTSDYNSDSDKEEEVNIAQNKAKRLSLELIEAPSTPVPEDSSPQSSVSLEERESVDHDTQKRIAVEVLEEKLQSGGLIREYSRIPKIKIGAALSSATAARNIYRNRYKDILPYEDNRVKLNPGNNLANNDYINASYIQFQCTSVQTSYLMTQGPLPHTCTDFWQMVWEHNTPLIIMATNLTEAGRVKCHQYFPYNVGEQIQFEQYRVTCTEHVSYDFGPLRSIEVNHIPTGQVRSLHQIQYTDWPDHGAPEHSSTFNEMMQCASQYQQDRERPSVVHCSAGVGRSGVVVLMDWLMQQIAASQSIDILGALRELRQQRMHLVQTAQQYIFIHNAFLQHLYSLLPE